VSRVLSKTMRDPSGDQAGAPSSAALLVIRVGETPVGVVT
jgi:hypothetical protein